MGLEINTIITLSNDEKYLVLKEIMHSGKKYFLVKNIDNEAQDIFEEELEGLDIYVKKVIDLELKEELTNLFNS